MKLVPLEQWYCDKCHDVIASPEQGWIEWLAGDDRKAYGFKIVHHRAYSPLKPEGSCYHYTNNPFVRDMHLHEYVKEQGLVRLLRFLDLGEYHHPEYEGPWVKNIREFVEIFRRLTIPYYEEARTYWGKALENSFFADANEIWIYLPENLKRLIELYED